MPITIAAAQVHQLRALTGAGVMDCKRALEAAAGDISVAASAMREAGQINAEKKAGRIAAEGLVCIASNPGCSVMLEINCETDFVSRDDSFKQFVTAVTQLAVNRRVESVASLLTEVLSATEQSVESTRQDLVAKLGENIQIRRLVLMWAKAGTSLGSYVHMGRIGAIVELQGGDEELAKDLALQIIANNPLVISSEDVTNEMLAREQEIFTAQAQASGKPQAVIDKMIEGRIKKFLDEVSLLGQSFIKNETISINELLEGARARVIKFVRYAVGDGIEKSTEDFAEAVMAAQAKAAP